MQTFLPYPSFSKSAKCLDMRRLGKQRVEAWQIFLALTTDNYGWQNHPAVKMWRGYEHLLCKYGESICDEWIRRGYKDTLRAKFISAKGSFIPGQWFDWRGYYYDYPIWIGNEQFHASHRSNLLRKDPVHYNQFGWTEPDNLPYVWKVE